VGKAAQPELEGIREAAARIRPHVPPTPLQPSAILSRLLDVDVWLKNETVTPVASFKLRGALNAMHKAREAGVEMVATSSTGNHGQGVAYSGRLLGIKSEIFLPRPVNPVKAAKIELYGGEVQVFGDDIDEAKAEAARRCVAGGGTFIDDGNDVDVMEGAGTVGLEIVESLPDVDVVLVPLGGGNLSSGVATAVKELQPKARVCSVQAKGSPAVTESFHERRKVERATNTVAEGLVTRVPPDLALQVLWERLDDAWLTTDETLLGAVRSLIECAQILVEPAGAAGLAGLCEHRDELVGKRVVLILTGANISRDQLDQALATPPLLSLGNL
jgi:threonine dehydratase